MKIFTETYATIEFDQGKFFAVIEQRLFGFRYSTKYLRPNTLMTNNSVYFGYVFLSEKSASGAVKCYIERSKQQNEITSRIGVRKRVE